MNCYLMWSVIAVCLCLIVDIIVRLHTKGFKVSTSCNKEAAVDSNKKIKICRIVRTSEITNISNILATFNETYNLNGSLKSDIDRFENFHEVSLTFELPKSFKLVTNKDLSVCKLEPLNDSLYNLPDKI